MRRLASSLSGSLVVLRGRVLTSRRHQSSTDASGTMIHSHTAGSEKVAYDDVWALWNEGNLFSLSVAQMQGFLREVGVAVDPAAKKAQVGRRVEEYLHAKDKPVAGTTAAAAPAATAGAQEGGGAYGRFAPQQAALPPETLLDLSQAGFYDGVANMAPKAFQLLCRGASPDAVITRINTSQFPGFPANTDCYSFVASDADVALKARFSKVLQWCFLNMSNLQMDGELTLALGKLLLEEPVTKLGTRNRSAAATSGSSGADGGADAFVVSAYALQQRMQLDKPYTWVTAVPEGAIAAAEAFLEKEGFALVTKAPRLGYEGVIKRAQDSLCVELDDQAKLVTVHNAWVDIQTVHQTHETGPDMRLLLRSRPPVRRVDADTFSSVGIVELSNDDVQDVLPPEHGQLVYLAENEVRRFERVNDRGVVMAVTETKRQPLIVLRDEEEDPRVEYEVSVLIPSSVGGERALDVRAVGLELFELGERFAAAVAEPFEQAFGN